MQLSFNSLSPEDKEKRKQAALRKKRNPVARWYRVILYVLIVGLIVESSALGTFHYAENFLICFIIASPLAFLATYALPLGTWYARYRNYNGDSEVKPEADNKIVNTENLYEAMSAGDAISGQTVKTAQPVGIGFLAANIALISAALAGIGMYINSEMDKSPAQELTLPVISKYISHGRHGGTYYHFSITSPAASPLPVSLSDKESFSVSSGTYAGIVLQQTQATIEMHAGYLGMPWHEKRYRLSGMMPSTRRNPAVTSQQVTAQFASNTAAQVPLPVALVKEACGWAANFDFKREIGVEKPDYYRQRNSNGMKAEEPMVAGQVHGLAKYWYPNGNYAEVTYRHGMVHGYFKVTAPNGTVIMNTPYKDGKRFGILATQAADGSNTQKLLIINERRLPVEACHQANPQ
ncbi:MAG TPA: hypothetical protein VFT64_03145 [Rickettsiales bacterium]|nr:hypothetical protein [Rickettsiales bacterium]